MAISSKIQLESNMETIWKALSDEKSLHEWYFPVENYLFEVGREFNFFESAESKNYLHKCVFKEIVLNKRIKYSWEHPDHSKGSSTVTWELSENDNGVEITLIHENLESFADAGPSFTPESYQMGWDAIVKTNLRNFMYGIKRLKFQIEINAVKSHVWEKLWNREDYQTWTNAFYEGSTYTGNLEQGGRIHFLTPEGFGMYSNVLFYQPDKMIIFQHIGDVKDGIELPLDTESEKWTGCFEIYKLEEADSVVTLNVEVDVTADHINSMNEKFPKGLEELKRICEK